MKLNEINEKLKLKELRWLTDISLSIKLLKKWMKKNKAK